MQSCPLLRIPWAWEVKNIVLHGTALGSADQLPAGRRCTDVLGLVQGFLAVCLLEKSGPSRRNAGACALDGYIFGCSRVKKTWPVLINPKVVTQVGP